ncbi:hypothetical protein HH310_10830 [Actinoplanes sp. TBRC 11911]|uniref:hypothetical protein n=1 Tax=Actinoplanes sp. TBRC 11911 TaxID=2729386 RepID=UPI00145E727D|nr:hypothetical protein [Actinoplanes sp. TBRC 11911]NMO51683.1 hypothetical protein [Actinoplanes sp. TBRC 11911]
MILLQVGDRIDLLLAFEQALSVVKLVYSYRTAAYVVDVDQCLYREGIHVACPWVGFARSFSVCSGRVSGVRGRFSWIAGGGVAGVRRIGDAGAASAGRCR